MPTISLLLFLTLIPSSIWAEGLVINGKISANIAMGVRARFWPQDQEKRGCYKNVYVPYLGYQRQPIVKEPELELHRDSDTYSLSLDITNFLGGECGYKLDYITLTLAAFGSTNTFQLYTVQNDNVRPVLMTTVNNTLSLTNNAPILFNNEMPRKHASSKIDYYLPIQNEYELEEATTEYVLNILSTR